MPSGTQSSLILSETPSAAYVYANYVVSGAGNGSDGTTGAPQRMIQYPTLLDKYFTRPSWNVAGVDYAVGIPAAKILKPWNDPSMAANAGVTVGANYVRFDSTANIVIDGYDFSAGSSAYIFFVGCTNVTITNCKFACVGPLYVSLSVAIIALDSTSSGLTLKYCEIDGNSDGGTNNGSESLISSTGTTVLQYNWLKNYPQQVLSMNGTGSASLDYRYNLIDNGFSVPSSSQYFLSFGLGPSATMSANVAYNTCYQTKSGGGIGFTLYSYTGGTFTSPNVSNNVFVVNGTAGTMTYPIFGTTGPAASGGTVLTGVGTINNNYAFIPSATSLTRPDSTTSYTGTGNINMANGATLSI